MMIHIKFSKNTDEMLSGLVERVIVKVPEVEGLNMSCSNYN